MKTQKNERYDVLVIGAGLSGMLVACELAQSGRRVLIVDAQDSFGGSSRAFETPHGLLAHGLEFLPQSPAAEGALAWLSTLLGRPVESPIPALPSVTFDGRPRPFTGFGTDPIASAEIWGQLILQPLWLLNEGPGKWTRRLTELYTGAASLRSRVTKLVTRGQRAVGAVINGNQTVEASEIVIATSPEGVTGLLDDEILPARLRARLQKAPLWTSLQASFIHPQPVCDSYAPHVLWGNTGIPVVGWFSPLGPSLQSSQWRVLLPRLEDGEEEVATALREIKKQIRRKHPEALDQLLFERVLVDTDSHGLLEGLCDEAGRFAKSENIRIASPLVHPARDLLGTLLQAQRVCHALSQLPLTGASGPPSETPFEVSP